MIGRLSGRTNKQGGEVHPGLLGSMAEVQEASREEIRRRAYEDDKHWPAWADEPVRSYMVVRRLTAVCRRVEVPDEAPGPEAEEAFAVNVAREWRMEVCLVLSRRASVWSDDYGKRPDDRRPPPTCPVRRMR